MSRTRAALLLLVSLVFVAGGAFILWRGEASDRALAVGCLAFFGACALVFAGQLFPSAAPTPDGSDVVIIQADRRQLIVLTVAAALMAGACPLIGRLAAADGQLATSWIIWAGAAFFGACAAIGLWRAIRARPLYRLDPAGITSLAGKGWRVPWRAIRGIEAFGIRGQAFLALDVDPAAGVTGGAMQGVNRAFGFPAFSIGVAGTGLLFVEFAELVGDYWTRHRGW